MKKALEFIEALEKTGLPKYLCESINSVRKAVFENGTRWIYFGVFLDDESRERLLSKFDIPEGWREYADHMTIVFNNIVVGTPLIDLKDGWFNNYIDDPPPGINYVNIKDIKNSSIRYGNDIDKEWPRKQFNQYIETLKV